MRIQFGLPKFTKPDVDFIAEYVNVLSPLVQALNILQGESNIYMGYLLPTIAVFKGKLTTLLVEDLRYCKPYVEKMVCAVDRRFDAMLKDEVLILAAVSHPRFNAQLLPSDEQNRAWEILK